MHARLGRLIVAATLVGYTLWRSNPREVYRVLTGAALGPLLIAVALVLLDRALMAWRWLVLLRSIERDTLPPIGAIVRIFFVSTFVGTFLPASIGGDAVRAYSLSRYRVSTGDAMASVFLDRMLGVLSLLLMAFLAFFIAGQLAAGIGTLAALVVTALACLATGLVVFSSRAEILLTRVLRAMPGRRIRRFAEETVAALRRYSAYDRELVIVLLASIGVQILRIVQAYYLGVSLRIDQGIDVYFMFVPLILLVMLLPITVNGLGTSQAIFVWLFGRIGTPGAEAFALSILFVALGIVGNLPGAFLYVTEPSLGPIEPDGRGPSR